MSDHFTHSPADVVRKALVDLGLGAEPPASPWPVYSTFEPPDPDEVVTVYDTSGVGHGRVMQGERQTHYGVQVRIRSLDHGNGYDKGRAIKQAVDSLYDRRVTVDGSNYLIHSFNRRGDVLPIGKEYPSGARSLFTIDGLITMRQV